MHIIKYCNSFSNQLTGEVKVASISDAMAWFQSWLLSEFSAKSVNELYANDRETFEDFCDLLATWNGEREFIIDFHPWIFTFSPAMADVETIRPPVKVYYSAFQFWADKTFKSLEEARRFVSSPFGGFDCVIYRGNKILGTWSPIGGFEMYPEGRKEMAA